ncbi:hypothetical protein GCM10009555_015090 [Acrocarpospora macrocephala]|uniref:Uncharacterized protein n=1 Tax=Acrocarpospora macrocephala TaxID=150177 RepID=A0A5M3WZD8_9ACTN|nr:hypothetical protein Amac_077470 [Acrocarpospora macrocephala]
MAAGSIIGQCGPAEWHVVVEVPALAVPDPFVPNGDAAPENLLYPACFRDATELRPVTVAEWERGGWLGNRNYDHHRATSRPPRS